MKIAYNGFWYRFNVSNNWFNYMFSEYYDEDIEFSSNIDNADIVVSSVFSPPVNTDAIKIFFTGESRKNGYTEDQIFLGFDETDLRQKKFRLPLWYTYINWWPDEFYPEQLVGDRKHALGQESRDASKFLSRPLFCSMVVSNSTDIRRSAFDALCSISRVDGYGAMFGNYFDGNKMDILDNYKFNICFENTISPGYVTEKLFEAKFAGCIPIYWGDVYSHRDFNPKSFIDFTEMSSTNDLVDAVRKIYSSEERMKEISSEPMFDQPPSLEPLFDFFDRMGLK